MTDRPQPAPPFTAGDWIGAALAAAAAAGLAFFPLVGRAFALMFRDMRSEELPLLTRLALSVWFPLAVATVATGGLVAGVRGRGPLAPRRACVVAAFVLGAAGLALCFVGAYLPIFSLAGNIKAD